MDTLGNILPVKFLGYVQWFIFIRISQLRDHSVSVNQARYAICVFGNDLETAAIKKNSMIHDTTLPHDIIFTKEYTSASDK